MAKKAKATGKVSSGNRSSMNKAKEERRQARFAKRKEEGKGYTYQPIPYKKDTKEYFDKLRDRAAKNVSHKTPIQRFTSIMRKLDNQLAKERKDVKEKVQKNRKVAEA